MHGEDGDAHPAEPLPPAGVPRIRSSAGCSPPSGSPGVGVRITPGEIALTRTPPGPNSAAHALVSVSTAPLVELEIGGVLAAARCVAKRYAIHMAQFVTRVEDRLASEVDLLVAAGVVASRSEAVRLGLERLVDRYRREAIARRIVEGYKRRPQTENDVGWSDKATIEMIGDEPW
jgi:Arc/MetJ-type ribon-helix-helix transcriptional regulator